MNFLCDMGVSMVVVEWLRRVGHDTAHLHEEGLHRLPDSGIFAKARSENRTVVTFDLDFGEIVALTRSRLPSVIVFRLRNARAEHVIERLESVLAESEETIRDGAFVVIEEHRHRVRHLPMK